MAQSNVNIEKIKLFRFFHFINYPPSAVVRVKYEKSMVVDREEFDYLYKVLALQDCPIKRAGLLQVVTHKIYTKG